MQQHSKTTAQKGAGRRTTQQSENVVGQSTPDVGVTQSENVVSLLLMPVKTRSISDLFPFPNILHVEYW